MPNFVRYITKLGMPKEQPLRPPTKGSFTKGDGRQRKKKGSISTETAIKRTIAGLANIDDLRADMAAGGLATLWHEIDDLPLKDRVQAKLTMIEYIYPKLGRIEMTIENKNEIIQIFGKQISGEDIKQIDEAEIISDVNDSLLPTDIE